MNDDVELDDEALLVVGMLVLGVMSIVIQGRTQKLIEVVNNATNFVNENYERITSALEEGSNNV